MRFSCRNQVKILGKGTHSVTIIPTASPPAQAIDLILCSCSCVCQTYETDETQGFDHTLKCFLSSGSPVMWGKKHLQYLYWDVLLLFALFRRCWLIAAFELTEKNWTLPHYLGLKPLPALSFSSPFFSSILKHLQVLACWGHLFINQT